ncbi:hypothetical protein RF11_05037 [Thelohanellus kitauei]|uniref:Uncharacterized protein n=1 Tax=Thelohanellus kitauei TaxID=669202 RepID=A0A0C2J663_THEKT|nr:hypothetical protein RF11_05037 [Thelohanellus kitauei]
MAKKSRVILFSLPSNASDLVIHEELKISYRGERFLLFDIFDLNVVRILIYSTDRQKTLLEHIGSVNFDKTFKIASSIFFQLFTIHVEYNNSVLSRRMLVHGLEYPYNQPRSELFIVDDGFRICPN